MARFSPWPWSSHGALGDNPLGIITPHIVFRMTGQSAPLALQVSFVAETIGKWRRRKKHCRPFELSGVPGGI